MKQTTIWMLILALGLAACGGSTTDEVPPAAGGAAGLDLSGLNLDVHQAPD
jgi:hypothetical protein